MIRGFLLCFATIAYKPVFHFYFLNIIIKVITYVIELKFCVGVNNVLSNGQMLQIFFLGLSFDFMSKNV